MSDEFWKDENLENDIKEEVANASNSEERKEYNKDEELNLDSTTSDNNFSTLNHSHIESIENEDTTYRMSKKDGQEESSSQSTYSFWAEQIATTNPNAINYENQSSDNTTPPYENDRDFHNSRMNDNNSNQTFSASEMNKKKKGKGRIKKGIKLVLSAAVFGLVAGGVFIGFNAIYYQVNPNAAPISINFSGSNNGGNHFNFLEPKADEIKISATTVSKQAIEQKTDITNVVDSTMPSIVTITTTYTQSYYDWFGQQVDQENEGGGSGIIVGKNDSELLIATNNHVVEGADPITVNFIDGTQAKAIIKGTDSVADLAVISINLSDIGADTLKTIKIATLGDSKSIKVGQMAIAIGNALGYGQSTTVGYISAKDREVQVDDKTMVLLQTDAAINPGNSGGALLNLEGEVIGINTVKYASSEVEGMGFAIPISRAMPIIDELMNREILKDSEKGYLGVYIQDVTDDVSKMYNWPVGVYVTETVEDGSAQKAGIVAGDIITKVNDTEVTAGTQLKEKVNSYRVGTEVTITVMRSVNGKFEEKQIKVTLGQSPQTGDTSDNGSDSQSSNK